MLAEIGLARGSFFGQFSVFFLPIVPAVDGGISSSLKYNIDSGAITKKQKSTRKINRNADNDLVLIAIP